MMNVSREQKGFVLAEVALAVLVIGGLLTALLPVLTQTRRSQAVAETRAHMDIVTKAVAAYVATYRCLPCPAPPGNNGPAFGASGTAGGQKCGTCAAPGGLVPFQALGLPPAMARDGWGHWLDMRVDPALTGDICREPAPKDATPRIRVKDGGAQEAVFVLLSPGANGYGAWNAAPQANSRAGTRLNFPAAMASCALGGDERCNADNDRDFVDSGMTSGEGRSDDQIIYFGRDILLGYTGATACHTAW